MTTNVRDVRDVRNIDNARKERVEEKWSAFFADEPPETEVGIWEASVAALRPRRERKPK
jgi:hypothetical protein